EPTQDVAHLRRLLAERLALTKLAAPVSWLRLRSIETTPWAGTSASFLPEDNRKGDKLHELVERLSARLGPQQVLSPVAQADHRPECRQLWTPALQRGIPRESHAVESRGADTQPPWLLSEPMPLDLLDGRPCYRGVLRKLVGPQRLEAGWWSSEASGAEHGEEGGRPAVRDYYIAESPEAGLVWVFRERPSAFLADAEPRWFLQGIYA
ncbi:MAG: DNA polymerase Y family protein, partial [Gammaproteobacteria bacterium]|nr:DNA polymerase Y family protein [Gammaproteobacteria bacterium]